MAEEDSDTVARVLKSNQDYFERKDVQAAAFVGFLLALVSFVNFTS